MSTTLNRSLIIGFSLILLVTIITFFIRWGVSVTYWSNPQLPTPPNSPVITWTLLISPYNTQDAIYDLFSTTKYSLLLRFYQISDKWVETLIHNLGELGINIQMIVENNLVWNNTKDFVKLNKKLSNWNIEIHDDSLLHDNYMHAKVAVIDKSTFLITSANLTYPSFWNNREYRFIWTHTWVAKSLVKIFAKDRTWEAILSGDIHDHLLVCPINCRQIIEAALSWAQRSIAIEAQYIEDTWVVQLLEGKRELIDVKLLIGEYQTKRRLKNLSQQSKIFDEYYLHAKNILIDDKLLIMWSMNLSTNALDNNREFWILIDDPYVIHQYTWQFLRDRSKSKSLD